jgi:hypothetical protein
MIIGAIVFSVLMTLLLTGFFESKPSKTPEEEFGEAFTNYLKSTKKIDKDDTTKK